MIEPREKMPPEAPEQIESAPKEKKPVILYIVILAFAVLLLMALSLLMSQRSDNRALDELQTSVNEIQQMQGSREEFYSLQQRVRDLEKAQSELEEQLENEQAKLSARDRERRALQCLLALQEAWELRDVDLCRIILQEMADESLVAALPDQSRDGLTPAAVQYAKLKESVLNWPGDTPDGGAPLPAQDFT